MYIITLSYKCTYLKQRWEIIENYEQSVLLFVDNGNLFIVQRKNRYCLIHGYPQIEENQETPYIW